jgi:hypothetical protein
MSIWQGGRCERCGIWCADRMQLALYIDPADGRPKFVCVGIVACRGRMAGVE